MHGDCRPAIDRAAFFGQARDRVAIWFRSGREDGAEAGPDIRQGDSVLRTFRSGDARFHLAQVELEQLAELWCLCAGDAEESLFLRVSLDEIDLLAIAASDLEVTKSLLINWEQRGRRAVLRAHVAQGRPVRDRKTGESVTAELDELVDHAVLAEHLCERQHEVGRGRSRGQRAEEAHADDNRWWKVGGLPEDRGLRLDSTRAPPQDAQAVDHRGVRIGAHQRVGDRHFPTADVANLDDVREVFEVDLVADAHPGRDQREVVERLLRPAQKGVALAVALDLLLDVSRVRVTKAEGVDLHGVVDDQVDGHQRVDLSRVLARALHRGSHRRQVDHGRHPREVLHQDACGKKGQLSTGRCRRRPPGQHADVGLFRHPGFDEPDQALEQDLDRHREA